MNKKSAKKLEIKMFKMILIFNLWKILYKI